MLTEQPGTPVAEREYIFTTPLDHGLSYKLCLATHPNYGSKIEACRGLINKSAHRSSVTPVTADDLIHKVKELRSDLWLSTDDADKIVGCFTVGVASYPSGTGVFTESMAGEFYFPGLCNAVEDFYKKLGFEFIEVQGRKGWERVLAPLGYEFANITMIKRLR